MPIKVRCGSLPFIHRFNMFLQACADKLKREMETYGNPPVFPGEDENVENVPIVDKGQGDIVDKAKGKKV